MTEEQVFLAALELTDPVARAAYLDAACGGAADLRRQVEELLAAHFRPGQFLDEPISVQLGIGSVAPADDGAVTPDPDDAADGEKPGGHADLNFLEPSPRPDALGRLGRYEVLQVLGRGGFGIVLRAFDDALQRVVAVKVLAPTMAITSPARRRFLREAWASAQVQHDNVIQVYAVEDRPLPYLVMEHVPGESLQQRLDRTGPLDPAEVVALGRQIAEGLAAAHATGLVHRDIKPANVLIEGGPPGRVRITDFGLARAADDASLTQSGVVAGTPLYMAPEQARGEPLDHRADLFSLGSVLYAMAAGRPPFRAATTYAVLKRVADDTPRPIWDVIPETPPWLCDIVAKLHAKKPADRFQSAREVADVLADCEAQLRAGGGVTDLSRIPRAAPAAGRPGRWKGAAVAAVLLPALAVAVTDAAGVTHWLRPPSQSQPPPSAPLTPGDPEYTNTLGMRFRLIPAGRFTMGTPQEEIDRLCEAVGDEGYQRMLRTEGPAHPVEITRPFYLGATEVTVGQFRRFVAANPAYRVGDSRWLNPGFPQTDDHPVVWVSWNDAVAFCKWLSEAEGRVYRLPTEAEWEYSCRAGRPGTRYCFGDDEDRLENYAVFNRHANNGTRPVGGKQPNDWGLYDMHGNVWEWCQDRYGPDYYRGSPATDPTGPADSGLRTQRGGSWDYGALECRSAFRSYCDDAEITRHRGFRVLLVPPPGGGPDEGVK